MKQFLLLSLVFMGFSASLLHAQNFEMQMRPDSVSGLDFQFRKFLFEEEGGDFFSGNFDLRYRHVLNNKINIIASLAYSRFGTDDPFSFDASSISNTYLGVQIKNSHKANNMSSIDVGIYLPTSDEDGSIGTLANIYEISRYVDDATTIGASYKSYYSYSDGFSFGYELGPDFIFASNDFMDDIEIVMRYGLNLAYSFSDVFIQSEILGIGILTEDDSFGDNTVHSYSIGLGFHAGQFIPRIYYKNFIDEDIGEGLDGILGIGVQYNFNE